MKGAPEALVPRCARLRGPEHEQPLDEAHRQALLAHARGLAERGLRVLMVAEGPAEASAEDPQELVALGFLGISDPLRPTVQDAVRRCREAGVRCVVFGGIVTEAPADVETVALSGDPSRAEDDLVALGERLARG